MTVTKPLFEIGQKLKFNYSFFKKSGLYPEYDNYHEKKVLITAVNSDDDGGWLYSFKAEDGFEGEAFEDELSLPPNSIDIIVE